MSFPEKFSSIFVITKYSGIYSGSEKSKTVSFFGHAVPFQFFYCVLLNAFLFALHAEMLYGLLSNKPCLYPPFFMAFCWGIIFWEWLKGFHSLLNKSKIDAIEQHWVAILTTQLWPELREKELNAVKAKITKFAFTSFCTLTVPMIMAAVFKTFWAGTVFIPSGFAPDYQTIEGPFWVVFLQNFSILFFSMTWIGSTMFVSLLMNVILAEFKYLRVSLEKIFDDFAENEGNILNETRDALKKWIEFHGKVLEFVRKFETTFSLIFAGQFLFITVAMCGLLFSTVSGKIPKENTVYCTINICGNMLLKLQLCRIGDAIAEQSSKLGLVCLSSMGLNLPHDIFSSLKVVNKVTQHDVMISMRGLTPVTSDTFRKMVILQYRFYAFISETQK